MSSPGSGSRRVTLADVAAFAGVSLATASKALNGRGDVRDATRERVRVAAERLGFEFNTLAQGLSAGRSGTVGMLTSDLVGRFSLPILMGAEDAFGAGQLSVFLCDARGDSIREQHHIRALLRRQIDGFIVVGNSTDPRPPLSLDAEVPVVYAYAPSTSDEDISVAVDDVAAGRRAVEHLVQMGRRRIAHIGGDSAFAAARDRAAGVTVGLEEASLPLGAGGRPHYGSWSESWGRTAARVVLELDPDVDSLVCANDQIARGAMEVVQQSGRGVPDDIAVIGFDNWEVLTADSAPPLTSLDLNLEGLGQRAAQLLVAAIEGAPSPGRHTVEPRLVVRESTGLTAHRR